VGREHSNVLLARTAAKRLTCFGTAKARIPDRLAFRFWRSGNRPRIRIWLATPQPVAALARLRRREESLQCCARLVAAWRKFSGTNRLPRVQIDEEFYASLLLADSAALAICTIPLAAAGTPPHRLARDGVSSRPASAFLLAVMQLRIVRSWFPRR